MIQLEHLSVDLDEFHLRDVSLSVSENEFFVLMGPTGAGKTVLLEAVAGLVPVQDGRILIGGRDVTHLPPEKRGISIMYQDYALFPHFTVLDNIMYGLHFHRVDKDQRQERKKQLIEQLNLGHLLHRYPATLSGGELQRVALARALIVRPTVLLLDEPLSALDPAFREEIRDALVTLQERSGVTFIMVTHDFSDALSLAQRACVINNGSIEQTGDIADIFQRPTSRFVADFVGMKNCYQVNFRDTKAVIDGIEIETGRTWWRAYGYIAIRPEDVVISKKPLDSSMRNVFEGRIRSVRDKGFFYEAEVLVWNTVFVSLITKSALFDLDIREGVRVWIAFKATSIHLF
ncbi:MAG: ABC transporter ATP-binding protein [Spirochaetes bacterium]|nr:ABC transporter ATP-binding protein [Spirochaetota bacterium]